MPDLYTQRMQKSFRTAMLAVGAFFLTGSLMAAAQTTPTPAPDAGTTAPQHRPKTGTSKKRSAKKGTRKKTARKKPAAQPQ
jgi:hypothetical protein